MKKIGIDIVENKRISLRETFIQKVLSCEEIKLLGQLPTKHQKIAFLAGRWAVKEAIWKASSLDQKITFNQINISYLQKTPIITNANLSKIIISISHEKKYSVGMAVDSSD